MKLIRIINNQKWETVINMDNVSHFFNSSESQTTFVMNGTQHEFVVKIPISELVAALTMRRSHEVITILENQKP